MGYFGQPAQTDAAFVNNPFAEGERMYRTGDLGQWAEDGTLNYLGRIDNQVKIRGYRIETAEVEAAILEVPGIRDAAVVVRVTSPAVSLAAFYTVSERVEISSVEVRAALENKIRIHDAVNDHSTR